VIAWLLVAVVATTPCDCEDGEAPPSHFVEVSFGQAQLYISEYSGGRSEEPLVPVSSALFLGEFLVSERFSAVALVNLPTTSHRTLVDGDVVEDYAAPAVALGVRASPLKQLVIRGAELELQVALLVGRTINSQEGDRFFPLLTTRVHFATPDGFTLYLGGATAFVKDTTALIYGVGHRF
jgi:hypothetical protein